MSMGFSFSFWNDRNVELDSARHSLANRLKTKQNTELYTSKG